jgi:hypothetical protein
MQQLWKSWRRKEACGLIIMQPWPGPLGRDWIAGWPIIARPGASPQFGRRAGRPVSAQLDLASYDTPFIPNVGHMLPHLNK